MGSSRITTRFGATVRNLRHRLGISQEMLAERADLHRTYVAEVESGKRNVTLKSIEKLARALHVSIDSLFSPDGRQAEMPQRATDEFSDSELAPTQTTGENRR